MKLNIYLINFVTKVPNICLIFHQCLPYITIISLCLALKKFKFEKFAFPYSPPLVLVRLFTFDLPQPGFAIHAPPRRNCTVWLLE